MKHYKNKAGEVFAFESDGSQDKLIAADLVPLSADEVAALFAKAAPTRAEAVVKRLAEIDAASIRPARAIAVSIASGVQADSQDVQRLSALESEAKALRAELASLK